MSDHRFTIRQLPLAAKLVVSAFLLTTGLGYFSALVQLHLQHSSRKGDLLPTTDNVIEIFAGKKKYDPNAKKPISEMECLVMGPRSGAPWNGTGSMAAAFFERSSDYADIIKESPRGGAAKLDAERTGEQLAVQAWIHLPDDQRKQTFAADRMPKPAKVTAITAAYLKADAITISSIICDRCARCHSPGGDSEKYPLETYEQIAKYLDVPKAGEPDARGFVKSPKQMSLEKLTQSTHAHLLSFGMLFGLTGLAFAFTSYPGWLRVLIAPSVLLIQVLDIACWWLARIDGVGPFFAQAIIFTGTLVAAGLLIQIIGTLFDMFDRRGRVALIALIALAAGGFGVLYVKAIEPALAAEKAKL